MMKIRMILLLLLSSPAFAQEPPEKNPNAPKMKFETQVYDYGTIDYASDGHCEFKFTNIGKEPLIISNFSSSCGCLCPEYYPKKPVAPGKSDMLKAIYDTHRAGNFEKTLTVTSNDGERPTIVLKIKGKVLPPPQETTGTENKKENTPYEKH
jgi:hypothetical protein